MNSSYLVRLIFVVVFCLQFNIKTVAQQSNKEPVAALKLPGMENVIIKNDIPYQTHPGSTLKMDVYYPPKFDFKSKIPVIVVVLGYTDEAGKKLIESKFKDFSWLVSWCKITAVSGFAAIVYETVDPENDIRSLEKYLQLNQDKLMIDMNRIGAYVCSAHTPTAVTHILNSSNNIFKCLAIYYGMILIQDFEYLSQIDTLSQKMGFKTPRLGDPKDWNKKVPVLFVRAGLDNVPYLNQAFNNFYSKALEQNLPITLINYSNGLHGFDLYNNNDTTRQIIKTTLDFWKFNLQVK